MNENGKGNLGAYALAINPPVVIVGEASASKVAWEKEGPNQVPLKALSGGFIIFGFDKSPVYSGGSVPPFKLIGGVRIPDEVSKAEEKRLELAYTRIVYMNAFLCALYSAISVVQKRGGQVQDPVDPTNYFIAKPPTDSSALWKIVMDAGRKVGSSGQQVYEIQTETLDNATNVLSQFHLKMGDAAFNILSLVYQACYQYRQHQFSSAHLIAWAAIEKMLNKEWQELQNEKDIQKGGHTKINRERKDLLNGRDYTASIISQMLSLAGKIDDEILERLDKARKKRNEFAHSLDFIESKSAGEAIRLATDLISKIIQTTVTSQLSTSYWI